MYDYSLVKKWTELPDGIKPCRVLFVHYAPEGAQGGLRNSFSKKQALGTYRAERYYGCPVRPVIE